LFTTLSPEDVDEVILWVGADGDGTVALHMQERTHPHDDDLPLIVSERDGEPNQAQCVNVVVWMALSCGCGALAIWRR